MPGYKFIKQPDRSLHRSTHNIFILYKPCVICILPHSIKSSRTHIRWLLIATVGDHVIMALSCQWSRFIGRSKQAVHVWCQCRGIHVYYCLHFTLFKFIFYAPSTGCLTSPHHSSVAVNQLLMELTHQASSWFLPNHMVPGAFNEFSESRKYIQQLLAKQVKHIELKY